LNLRASSYKKTAIIYWPFSIFNEVHIKKDVGSIAKSLGNKGYETTLIVGKYNARKIENINIYETGNSHYNIMNPVSHVTESIMVFKKLASLNPDLVITYNRNPFLFIIILLYKFQNLFHMVSKKSTKFVMKMTSDGNFRFTNFPLKMIRISILRKFLFLSTIAELRINYKFLDSISIETECGMEKLKYILNECKKLVVVPNGCSNEYFLNSQRNAKERDEVILVVSRIVEQKGLETFIEAYAKVAEKFRTWCVKIIGEIEDENYYIQLYNIVKRLKLETKIMFEGKISDKNLLELYSTSSIFCLPSNWEDDSISRREAIASGLPVITTEAGCGKLLEQYGSIVVPIKDPDSLALGMEKLMSNDKLRDEISLKQKKAVVSWDDVVEKYLII
jgi:glycosyltransferase involved in cell wall biosynthesis